MKLKKIVSLALAGVLAVSMLAGCKNGTGSSSSTPTEEPTSDLTSLIIAELNDETPVTFTADSTIETAVEKMVAYYGLNGKTSDYNYTNLKNFYTDIATDSELPDLDAAGTRDDDDKEVTATAIYYVATTDSNVNYAAKKIASELAAKDVTKDSAGKTLAKLPDMGNTVTNAANKSVYYTFKYTGKIAVVPVADELNTVTGYVVAFDLIRTPTEVLA